TDPDLLTWGIYSDQFNDGQTGRGFARGFRMSSGGYQGPSYFRAAALNNESSTTLAELIPTALRSGKVVPVSWGTLHHVAFQERVNHTIGLGVSGEELPYETNRVELHPTLTDDMGIPAPKIVFKRSENLEKQLTFGMERAKELLL